MENSFYLLQRGNKLMWTVDVHSQGLIHYFQVTTGFR